MISFRHSVLTGPFLRCAVVHLDSIPPVLRWLQWLCPLKFALEAMSVNEVTSGLMIQDVLQGVPVDVSALLILNLLFGFGANDYYR